MTSRRSGLRTRAGAILALLTLPLLPELAFAWGDEGHQIVAMIAAKRLTPAAAQQVDAILQPETACGSHEKLSCVATWADSARNTTHPETYNWHFVDISLENRTYDAGRDCEPDDQATKGKCGIFGLDHALRILRQEVTDLHVTRSQALMFVVHIVGDLHQPLHTVKEKVGGNFFNVKYFDVPTNLHKVWDSKILGSRMMMLHKSEEEYADMLNGGVDPSFEQGDPIAWLNETHATAIDDAYGWLKRSRKTTEQHPKPWLRTTYFRHNWPIVDRQLERAGARLAKVLNDALH